MDPDSISDLYAITGLGKDRRCAEIECIYHKEPLTPIKIRKKLEEEGKNLDSKRAARNIADGFRRYRITDDYPPSEEERRKFYKVLEKNLKFGLEEEEIEYLINDHPSADSRVVSLIEKGIKDPSIKECFQDLTEDLLSISHNKKTVDEVKEKVEVIEE